MMDVCKHSAKSSISSRMVYSFWSKRWLGGRPNTRAWKPCYLSTNESCITIYLKLLIFSDECANFLNEIANVEEGLIIKDPRSIYRPKIQSNDWWKLKPEFIGNLSEQLDLLILGGYRGLGNKMASNFLLGAAEINEGGNPTRFRSICRIAVGFKRQELESMILRLQAYFTMWEDSAPPDFVVLNDGRAHKPDFWISPQHSCVLQIRAAQLVRCGSFAAGYTLRFPHVARIRHDKAWWGSKAA